MRLLVFFLPILLFGCTSSGTEDDEYQHIFRYNQPSAVTSLDPAFARSQPNIWATDHLYNGLVKLDDKLRLQPSIAKHWEVRDSGHVYRFTIRNDVYFHDDKAFKNGRGRKLIAADIVYSFGRIIDESVHSPGSWIFQDKLSDTRPFIAVNDTVFELHLKKPFLPMLGILTMPYCYIVPREAVEKYGFDFRRHPVGTGPFRYKNWIEGQGLALVKNKKYFEKNAPKSDGILVSFIPDRKTAFLELKQGNIDFMSGLESSYAQDALNKNGQLSEPYQDKLQFIKAPYLNTEYLGVNLDFGDESNPLRNKLVRQALNYGIDREAMLRTLRRNVGTAATSGFVPRGLPSFSEKVKGYGYDPQRARQLLSDAGHPNGEGLPAIKLHVNSAYLDLCTFIARQWEDIGLDVNIELVESATLRQMMSKGQAAFFRASWIADYPDAENFLTVFYGKNPAPPNYTRFNNPTFDKLYEAALIETNDSLRYELYHKMDSILVEEAPVVFLFYDQTALFARSSVRGISRNAINLLKVEDVAVSSRQ